MKPGTPDLTANRQIHKKAFAMKYRQPSKALNCSQKKIQTPEQSKQVERTLPLLTLLLLQPSPRWALSPFLLPYLYASAHQVSSTTKALAPSPWHLLNILPHPLQPASPVISHPQLNGSQALPAGSNLSRPCPMSPSLSWPPQAGPHLLCLPVQLCFAHSTRSRACSEEPLRKCSPNLLKSHRGPNKVAILLIGAKVVALRSLKNFHWLRERRNMAKGTGDKMCQGGLRTRRLCEKITAEKSPLHQERKLELDKPPKLLALSPPSPPNNPSPSFSCNR